MRRSAWPVNSYEIRLDNTATFAGSDENTIFRTRISRNFSTTNVGTIEIIVDDAEGCSLIKCNVERDFAVGIDV